MGEIGAFDYDEPFNVEDYEAEAQAVVQMLKDMGYLPLQENDEETSVSGKVVAAVREDEDKERARKLAALDRDEFAQEDGELDAERLLDIWFNNQVADMKLLGQDNFGALLSEYQSLQNDISQGTFPHNDIWRRVYGENYVPAPIPTPTVTATGDLPTPGLTVIPLDTATPEPSEEASQVDEIQNPVEYVHQEFLALTADIDPDLRPSDEQIIQNIEMIIEFAAQEDYQLSTDELAYVLATAQFESAMGGEMAERWDCYDASENIMPCENSSLNETEQANYHFEVLYYDNLQAKENLGNDFRSDAYSFYGRGFVQLTGRGNYQKFTDHFLAEEIEFLDEDGEPINLDLTGSFTGDSNPFAALDPQVATYILVHGMQEGLFTTFSLSDFQTEEGFDFYNARQIVNPGDEVEKYQALADLAVQYAASLGDLCKKSLLPEGIRCLP